MARRRSIAENGNPSQKQGDGAQDELEVATAAYVQQSYSAKLLGVMAATYSELCEKMMHRQVVSALLCAIGNTKYPDSQRYAANTVLFLTQKYPAIQKAIEESMGHHFWQAMDTQPDNFFANLSKEQVKALKRNQIVVQVDSSGQITTTSNVTRSGASSDNSDNESDSGDTTNKPPVLNEAMGEENDDESAETEKNQDSSEAEAAEYVVDSKFFGREVKNTDADMDKEAAANAARIAITAENLYKPLTSVSVNQTLAVCSCDCESPHILRMHKMMKKMETSTP